MARETPMAHLSALCLAYPTATFTVPLSRWELRVQVLSFAPRVYSSDYPNTGYIVIIRNRRKPIFSDPNFVADDLHS